MRAKDLAELAGTTVRTVRYYHQLGLLSVPEKGTTWRAYGFAHLTRLMRIRWLVESGVPLAEVPHMLRPPGSADERTVVDEDLASVLVSMDARIAALTEQRAAVRTLLERVRTRGRLSPLPDGVVRMYTAMLDRPLPEQMRAAISRERDLLELACYRVPFPDDLEQLIDTFDAESLEEVSRLWEQVHQIDVNSRTGLDDGQRRQLTRIVTQVVELAEHREPSATAHLLGRAAELNRPAVRTAIELAYPSPAYRFVVATVIARATETHATDGRQR